MKFILQSIFETDRDIIYGVKSILSIGHIADNDPRNAIFLSEKLPDKVLLDHRV
jgi:hypothetical protein